MDRSYDVSRDKSELSGGIHYDRCSGRFFRIFCGGRQCGALTTEKSHGAGSHSWDSGCSVYSGKSANDKGGSTQHFSVETAASGGFCCV